MILSSVPRRYQDGIFRQAGVPDGSLSAPTVAGRWEAVRIALSSALSPLANDARTVDFLR
jgi:hypothetical protein